MNQIHATYIKTMREFIREKTVLFWTIAWPILWVIMGSFVLTGDAPEEALPHIRGTITLSMMVFVIMIAGMANIPANIGQDRERGLLSKLKSMPVQPWKDFLGRFFAFLTFSCIVLILVGCFGYVVGGRISGTAANGAKSLGFLILASIASAGIGMLIGTVIKNIHGIIMTGVGISVVSAALSGIMIPYSVLPPVLQRVAQIYPVASVNSSVIWLMVGEEAAGYNPLTAEQVMATVAGSLLLFITGLVVYSKFAWKEE